jgi:hypothetical protein
MAFLHGKSATILFGQRSLSEFLNEVSIARTVETGETTNFRAAGFKTYVTGLQDAALSLSGMFDGSAGAVDQTLQAAFTSDLRDPVSVSPEFEKVGAIAYLVDAHTGSYDVTSPVADVVSISSDIQAEGRIDRGVFLTDGSAISATSSGASFDSGAGSTNGAIAHLHISNNDRDGTVTATIQSSADNVTWVDLSASLTVSASTTGTLRAVAAGTINRYLRVNYTVAGSTGSATVHVALARR